MGKIKKILENELVGGTQTTDVYPVTSIKAVYDENNERLDSIINRRGVVNISTNYNSKHIAEVLTLSQALSKVPSAGRVLGFQGKYLASDGWHTIIYTGDNLTDWSDKTKWIDLVDKIFNSISNNATFAGIATPKTNPSTPDGPVFYIANGKGKYEKFGGLEVTEDDVVVFYWDSSWHKVSTGIASQEKLSELDERISESVKENSLAPCAESGFYICNEVGDVIAFYDNGWKFIESNSEIASKRKVYGIEINNADGSVKRYADAIGLNTNYVIGDVFAHDGSNDFDSIFPWCDMRLCNVKVINGIKHITYKGEEGFSRDGSNGDLMIEIPKFYTMRKCIGDREITCITGENKSGFLVEPAFHDSETGEEINYIYVAAYLSDISNGHHTSVTNSVPTTRASLLDFRQAGEMYDFVTLQALQKLFSIEFGTINTGEIFGGLSSFPLNYCAPAYEDAESTNTAVFWSLVATSINPVDNFQVGQSIMIKTVGDSTVPERRKIIALGDIIEYTDEQGTKHRRSITFSGNPVSIKSSKMYGSSVTDYPAGTSECSLDVQENGLTDNLIYHTGRTAISATTTTNQFKYRNIEGLWGNVGEMFDGARFKDLEYYIAMKKSDYANLKNYRKLSYKGVAQTTYDAKKSVILRMGYDNRLPTINLPVAISSDNTSVLIFGKYYGDILSSFNEAGKEYIGISSMAWDGDKGNGFYMYRFRETENGKSELYGTRMIYRNL